MHLLPLLFCLGGPVRALPAPAATDLGVWDCSGSKTVEITVPAGDSQWLWRGDCPGAEGWDVIVEPQGALRVGHDYDRGTRMLTATIHNPGKAVKVKVHVFVGFA